MMGLGGGKGKGGGSRRTGGDDGGGGGDEGLNFCRMLDNKPPPGLFAYDSRVFGEAVNSSCGLGLTFLPICLESLISCCSRAACASRSAFC